MGDCTGTVLNDGSLDRHYLGKVWLTILLRKSAVRSVPELCRKWAVLNLDSVKVLCSTPLFTGIRVDWVSWCRQTRGVLFHYTPIFSAVCDDAKYVTRSWLLLGNPHWYSPVLSSAYICIFVSARHILFFLLLNYMQFLCTQTVIDCDNVSFIWKFDES